MTWRYDCSNVALSVWFWGLMLTLCIVAPVGCQAEDFRSLPETRTTAVPESTEDPRTVRKRILSIRDPAELQQFLIAHGLAVQPPAGPLGFSDHNGEFISLAAKGLAVDLFFSNLFGDQQDEAILQIRFRNAIYFVTFFYQKSGRWYRVPGIIALNRETASNAPCDSAEAPGGGYFYFSLVEARATGEHLIMGKTYGGWCPPSGVERGTEITLSIWQVTHTDVPLLFQASLQSVWTTSPLPIPTREPKSQQCSWTDASSDNAFPKKLQCEVGVYASSTEELPDGSHVPTWVQTHTKYMVHELAYRFPD